MKLRFLLLLISLGTVFGICAQEVKKPTQFSPEIKLSFNLVPNSFLGYSGFGVGFHNAFFNHKRCNLIVGLEYNGIHQRFHFLEDEIITDFYNYIGIPINCRVNFGKKVKFFIEAGGFFDAVVFETLKSLKYGNKWEKENIVTTYKFHKPDFGFSGGIGLRIPIKKYEIFIKSDYKNGLRCFYKVYGAIHSVNRYWRVAVGFKI